MSDDPKGRPPAKSQLQPFTAGLGPRFAELERRAQANAQVSLDLTTRVRAALTGPEKDHIVSASCRGDTLVILADSAVWCPQIRYAQTQLLEQLRGPGETRFTKLKVRVGRAG